MELNEIRVEIDKLDRELQQLFEQRMQLCREVAQYKKAHNMPVFQADREQLILDRVEKNAAEGLGAASRTLFSNIMSISSQLQQKMLVAAEAAPEIACPHMETAVKIGCQGITGANSETAARAFFPNRDIAFYPTFEQVFAAVEAGELEYGVLPIYNSTSGTVTQTVDLMGKYSFFITAMNQVEVTHCLAALPGTRLEDIRMVYSHPQALSQCSGTCRATRTATPLFRHRWWQSPATAPSQPSALPTAPSTTIWKFWHPASPTWFPTSPSSSVLPRICRSHRRHPSSPSC